jgi:metallophosphoesterase (TIGR00282 family)
MQILFIGDIVAKPGKKAVIGVLPALREKEKIDLVVANVENVTEGRGATEGDLRELLESGVDFFTSGPHIFAREEIFAADLPLIRPANYPSNKLGKGASSLEVGGEKVLVINLVGDREFIGRHYLEKGEKFANPFTTASEIISSVGDVALILVDFHSELTSEQRALGFFLDGKAAVVVGTHTHVPTADEQILPGGTGTVTDLGMCGAQDSVLGVVKETIIERLAEGKKDPFRWVQQGPAAFNSVLFEVDGGKTVAVKRIDRSVA